MTITLKFRTPDDPPGMKDPTPSFLDDQRHFSAWWPKPATLGRRTRRDPRHGRHHPTKTLLAGQNYRSRWNQIARGMKTRLLAFLAFGLFFTLRPDGKNQNGTR